MGKFSQQMHGPLTHTALGYLTTAFYRHNLPAFLGVQFGSRLCTVLVTMTPLFK